MDNKNNFKNNYKKPFNNTDNKLIKNNLHSDVSDQNQEERDNIVCGRNSVIELMKGNRTVEKLLVSKGDKEGSVLLIISMARERNIPIIEAEKAQLERISNNSNHQGVVAYATDFKYCEINDIIQKAADLGEKPFIVIIDGVSDPRNLGAIIRTADASGVHGIIIPKRSSCTMTSAVNKSSAGAVEFASVARVTNISSAIEELKKQNIWIYGADGECENTLYQTDFTDRAVALVLGNEGQGLSKLVKTHCDYLVKIPMKGNINSLNVSVAGAILMYEVIRQKG